MLIQQSSLCFRCWERNWLGGRGGSRSWQREPGAACAVAKTSLSSRERPARPLVRVVQKPQQLHSTWSSSSRPAQHVSNVVSSVRKIGQTMGIRLEKRFVVCKATHQGIQSESIACGFGSRALKTDVDADPDPISSLQVRFLQCFGSA